MIVNLLLAAFYGPDGLMLGNVWYRLPIGILPCRQPGQSTEVTIQDRGPHVKGRIVDLPPAKAEEIGLTSKKGVAKVEVAPSRCHSRTVA